MVDKQQDTPSSTTSSQNPNNLLRPSLGPRDERPSSEFLGLERSRISIIVEDSDERPTSASPTVNDDSPSPDADFSPLDVDFPAPPRGGPLSADLDEKPPLPLDEPLPIDLDEKPSPSIYSSDEEDLNADILPDSLTETWESKTQARFSCADTLQGSIRPPHSSCVLLDEKDHQSHHPSRPKRRQSINSITSDASRCSHCGHHRRASSATLSSNRTGALSPTNNANPHRRSSGVTRHTSLRITPRVHPTSPSAAAAIEQQQQQQQQQQRAFPLVVKRGPARSTSEATQTLSAPNTLADPHSETASFISSIFAPPLRHLASHPSLNGSGPRAPGYRGSLVTPVDEQRHPGKAGARISRFTRPFEPDIDEDDGEDYLRQVRRLEALRAQQRVSALPGDFGGNKEECVEGWPLAFLVMGICLVVFSISVDRTILTTAVPYITSEFQSTADIGWYGSAYLLTACAFQPVYGRVFMLFSIKWSYMLALFMFLVGSLVCAVAPSSIVLIVGRAVAGFGSAGILTGSFVVVATAVPLRLRPIYTAIVGLMFAFGATVGPLLGGVFTDLVTWRWCFYMNLPIGGLTLLIFLAFFHPSPAPRPFRQTLLSRLLDLDVVGNLLLLGACVMLFLALEHTTQGSPWSSTPVVGLLSGAAATAVVFAAWQWWKQDGALIPPAVVTQRTVLSSCVAAFCIYGALLLHAYFLPIWFQAVRGESAIGSGVAMIPYVATNAVFSLLAGVFVSVVGYFVPPAVFGSVVGTVGCGVLRLLSPSTPTAHWIGFQVLVSAGFGMAIQQGFTAVQAVLPPDEIAIGTAAVVASQSLGGAVFVSVGNALFQNQLLRDAVPGVDVRAVLEAGATAFRTEVPADLLPALLEVYNGALRVAFTAAIPLAGVAAIASCWMEWRSVRGKKVT
ncbi:Efflux pump roqT [Colletotrichum spinosum]|uniref:Efflux pump roqT n=1 Tax=Colletotrichum spinosum TaxID=1347390 RepID=A0A4R8PRN8_9PEZI|nr:Efflux pump roqT [Colletotrichum spinosum]